LASCQNHGLAPNATNKCWNTNAVNINFTDKNTKTTVVMPSLLDSGAGNASIQYTTPPTGIKVIDDSANKTKYANIMKQISINISGKNHLFDLPGVAESDGSVKVSVEQNKTSQAKVNVGNHIFNKYNVLYNQTNGQIGLLLSGQ
jgi:hypothetical protein